MQSSSDGLDSSWKERDSEMKMRLFDEEDVTCSIMMMMIDVHIVLNCDENFLINIKMTMQ